MAGCRGSTIERRFQSADQFFKNTFLPFLVAFFLFVWSFQWENGTNRVGASYFFLFLSITLSAHPPPPPSLSFSHSLSISLASFMTTFAAFHLPFINSMYDCIWNETLCDRFHWFCFVANEKWCCNQHIVHSSLVFVSFIRITNPFFPIEWENRYICWYRKRPARCSQKQAFHPWFIFDKNNIKMWWFEVKKATPVQTCVFAVLRCVWRKQQTALAREERERAREKKYRIHVNSLFLSEPSNRTLTSCVWRDNNNIDVYRELARCASTRGRQAQAPVNCSNWFQLICQK